MPGMSSAGTHTSSRLPEPSRTAAVQLGKKIVPHRSRRAYFIYESDRKSETKEFQPVEASRSDVYAPRAAISAISAGLNISAFRIYGNASAVKSTEVPRGAVSIRDFSI